MVRTVPRVLRPPIRQQPPTRPPRCLVCSKARDSWTSTVNHSELGGHGPPPTCQARDPPPLRAAGALRGAVITARPLAHMLSQPSRAAWVVQRSNRGSSRSSPWPCSSTVPAAARPDPRAACIAAGASPSSSLVSLDTEESAGSSVQGLLPGALGGGLPTWHHRDARAPRPRKTAAPHSQPRQSPAPRPKLALWDPVKGWLGGLGLNKAWARGGRGPTWGATI